MKPKSKSQLAKEFRISYSTFSKWLKAIPELELKPNQRILYPKQINMLYEYYGEP